MGEAITRPRPHHYDMIWRQKGFGSSLAWAPPMPMFMCSPHIFRDHHGLARVTGMRDWKGA